MSRDASPAPRPRAARCRRRSSAAWRLPRPFSSRGWSARETRHGDEARGSARMRRNLSSRFTGGVMEIDETSLEELRSLSPRRAYEAVRRAVLQNPWGASSEDLRSALEQMVAAGILTWDEVERFEVS